jgi:Rv0078B-related antitoxin
MGFADALDQMPRGAVSASERFREALAMFEEGVALQRQNLRRRNPTISETQLDEMLQAWLAREDTL